MTPDTDAVVDVTPAVRAANALTGRWAATHDTGTTVMCGPGVWPLLAVLASGAAGPAYDELTAAVGMRGADLTPAARELVALLDGADGMTGALGLWTDRELPVRPQWLAGLPPHLHDALTGDPAVDQRNLDAWADRHTGGLIKRFPVRLDPTLLLVLGSAVAMRTTWTKPFRTGQATPAAGPWAARTIDVLTRDNPDVDDVCVVPGTAGPLTVLTVRGSNELDVALILGEPDAAPGVVLSGGVDAVTGEPTRHSGAALLAGAAPLGPGLALREETGEPRLVVQTVGFKVRAKHDLLAVPEVVGLRSACGPGHHFPGISAQPLQVDRAAQEAMARFDETGFVAAAVSGIAMRSSAVPMRRAVPVLHVDFDRPFGFVALHRRSRLAVFAGWIADPN